MPKPSDVRNVQAARDLRHAREDGTRSGPIRPVSSSTSRSHPVVLRSVSSSSSSSSSRPISSPTQSVSSLSRQQCQTNCNIRRSNCLTFSSGNPSAPNAFKLQQCHTQHRSCSTFCGKLK